MDTNGTTAEWRVYYLMVLFDWIRTEDWARVKAMYR